MSQSDAQEYDGMVDGPGCMMNDERCDNCIDEPTHAAFGRPIGWSERREDD